MGAPLAVLGLVSFLLVTKQLPTSHGQTSVSPESRPLPTNANGENIDASTKSRIKRFIPHSDNRDLHWPYSIKPLFINDPVSRYYENSPSFLDIIMKSLITPELLRASQKYGRNPAFDTKNAVLLGEDDIKMRRNEDIIPTWPSRGKKSNLFNNNRTRREEDVELFWGNRGKKNDDSDVFWGNRGKKNAEQDPFWGNRGRRNGDSDPFWGNRGKKDDDSVFWGNRGKKNDDDPFWGNRGKKAADDEPFWGNRGKKDEDPFWGNRGKKDDEEAFWGNRGKKDDEEAFWGNRGKKDDEEAFWGNRGKKNDEGAFWGNRGKKDDEEAFWGNRGKKDDDEAFWGNRGKRDDNEAFWGNRGKREDEEAFWGNRGKKYDNEAFWGTRGKKDDEEAFWGNRGKKDVDDPFWGNRGKRQRERLYNPNNDDLEMFWRHGGRSRHIWNILKSQQFPTKPYAQFGVERHFDHHGADQYREPASLYEERYGQVLNHVNRDEKLSALISELMNKELKNRQLSNEDKNKTEVSFVPREGMIMKGKSDAHDIIIIRDNTSKDGNTRRKRNLVSYLKGKLNTANMAKGKQSDSTRNGQTAKLTSIRKKRSMKYNQLENNDIAPISSTESDVLVLSRPLDPLKNEEIVVVNSIDGTQG